MVREPHHDNHMFNLTPSELRQLTKLNTPVKIQDYLDSLPTNFERSADTCYSPRKVMRLGTAHCMEGAMLAALALRLQGQQPLVMDLKSIDGVDDDHVVALFRQYGRWGGITKTNHAVLRYREPVYRSARELALSFFHEYFLPNGRKTLRSYSTPLNLKQFDKRGWMTAEDNIWYVPETLNESQHFPILQPRQIKNLRRADAIEIAAGELTEWDKCGKKLSFTKRKK